VHAANKAFAITNNYSNTDQITNAPSRMLSWRGASRLVCLP
jgi:hypothetical protein